jgi:hypothetical protein
MHEPMPEPPKRLLIHGPDAFQKASTHFLKEMKAGRSPLSLIEQAAEGATFQIRERGYAPNEVDYLLFNVEAQARAGRLPVELIEQTRFRYVSAGYAAEDVDPFLDLLHAMSTPNPSAAVAKLRRARKTTTSPSRVESKEGAQHRLNEFMAQWTAFSDLPGTHIQVHGHNPVPTFGWDLLLADGTVLGRFTGHARRGLKVEVHDKIFRSAPIHGTSHGYQLVGYDSNRPIVWTWFKYPKAVSVLYLARSRRLRIIQGWTHRKPRLLTAYDERVNPVLRFRPTGMNSEVIIEPRCEVTTELLCAIAMFQGSHAYRAS